MLIFCAQLKFVAMLKLFRIPDWNVKKTSQTSFLMNDAQTTFSDVLMYKMTLLLQWSDHN
jgi:hypothetical protein